MILPGIYANGFAPRDGEPLFPELWRNRVIAWNPGLGPSGLTLRDWSMYKNHGTLTNMEAATDWVASQGRYALDFDGSNDFVIADNYTPTVNGTSSASLSVWMLTQSSQTLKYILSAPFATAGSNGFDIHVDGGTVVSWLTTTVNSVGLSATVTYANSQWNHIAATYDGVTHRLYFNGVQVKEAARIGTIRGDSNQINLGRFGTFGAYFAGQIDDAGVYGRGLHPNEIRLLASRRGIAYEMSPRNWSAQQIAAYRAKYYSQLVGGGIV